MQGEVNPKSPSKSRCCWWEVEVPLAAFATNLLFCASSLLGSGGLFPLQTPCLVDVGLEEICESGAACMRLYECTCRAAGQLPGCSKECWGRDLARHLGDIRDTRSMAKSRKKSLLCALLRLRFPPLQLRNFVQIFRWATQRNTLPGEENREVLRFFQRKVP